MRKVWDSECINNMAKIKDKELVVKVNAFATKAEVCVAWSYCHGQKSTDLGFGFFSGSGGSFVGRTGFLSEQ